MTIDEAPRIIARRPKALVGPLIALALLAGTDPARAAGGEEALTALAGLEARLLAEEARRYQAARAQADGALEALAEALRELDAGLTSPVSTAEELRRLAARAATRRRAATAALDEAAELARRMIERRATQAALDRELAELRASRLVPESGIDGRWQLEVRPLGVAGLIELQADGSVVSGTYRLDGAAGSVRGTFTGRRLRLERIDLDRGLDAVLEGELDPESGELTGTWTAVDVSGGAPSTGDWTGRRIGG